MSVIYGVVSTLVNLCNAYDKQEIIPEMLGNYTHFIYLQFVSMIDKKKINRTCQICQASRSGTT
jgi:hypothetical protein